MDEYIKELNKQKAEIEKLLITSEKNIRKLESVPDKKIRIVKSNGYSQYLFLHEDGSHEYIPSAVADSLRPYLQKHYEKKANCVLKHLHKELTRFQKNYDYQKIYDLYDNASDGRKKMISPIVSSTDDYIKEWLRINEGNKNTFYGEGYFLTEQGEHVRSKSEKIIADMLFKYKVPYRYEPNVRIDNTYDVFPDFVALNVRRRKTIYWEHLGKIDDMKYAFKNMNKLYQYEKNSYVLGDDLIVTMETTKEPLNVVQVEKKILDILL